MKCITAGTFLLHHGLQRRRNSNYTWLCRSEPTRFLRHPQRSSSVNNWTAATAISTASLVLADVAQPKGDIYVFLQTGGLMLMAYLMTNFVVPTIVSKQLQLDESAAREPDNKSHKSIREDKLNDQPTRERGFNSPKPR
uniref:Uncharacterized protein n=1 Tax=Kalanchoe fedtschenkoi TaxID=63787 RepID=A0A7N0VBJ6_KALFE